MTPRLTRRDLLRAGVGAAGLAAIPSVRAAASLRSRMSTASVATGAGQLSDIQHVVILMQENRSFDHYFGTLRGVRGFDDRSFDPNFPAQQNVFTQQVYDQNRNLVGGSSLMPFHLDTLNGPGMCTPDITHAYGDQHTAWNGGNMDLWGLAHSGDNDQTYMGYYTRADLPYYYALADAFTICDGYHSSVMGSTSGNRCYAMTGMFDAQGLYGGPVFSTVALQKAVPSSPTGGWGVFSDKWITYPELLTEAGVSWKSYDSPDGDDEDNPLPLFKQYWPQNYTGDPVKTARAAQLRANISANFPVDFLRDAAAGTLPSVSWITTSIVQSEHPSAAPQDGEVAAWTVVSALMNSPLWPNTALFITYDENGGFFDHVTPPTAPPNTAGEYAVRDANNYPIGLGFRVPMLVISPFSQGGFVASDVFDHTSILRFLEARFNVPVPNLTDWRRQTVGDLTSAFNFATPVMTPPEFVPPKADTIAEHPECATEEASGTPYPTPTSQSIPQQEPGTRPTPSGPVN